MDRKRVEAFACIPKKANQVLWFFLAAIVLFSVKIWYLTVYRHEESEKIHEKYRKKVVWVSPYRGTIRDRFNIVLAGNQITYRAGIVYGPIQEIPRKIFQSGSFYPLRKKYIEALSKKIASILCIDEGKIRDCLYAYGPFSPQQPLILCDCITEEQYYRLNMMAKDWPGLVVERSMKRVYPLGRIASHLLGYTSSISFEEHKHHLEEYSLLKKYIDAVDQGLEVPILGGISSYAEAKRRCTMLEQMAYKNTDQVGKMGIEASFERELRGGCGKKHFLTNAYGNIVRETSGSVQPVSGKRLILTISAQLQEFCEKLLAISEEDREKRLELDTVRVEKGAKNPFVRGGAIVAMDPHSGEIVAFASFPRFDPNDFVKAAPSYAKKPISERVFRWLESDAYLCKVFNGEEPFIREIVVDGKFSEVASFLTWDIFLDKILPKYAKHRFLISSKKQIQECLSLTDAVSEDLFRLLVRKEEFSEPVLRAISKVSLGEYFTLLQYKVCAETLLKKVFFEAFVTGPFTEWRKTEEKAFLEQQRREEKIRNEKPKGFLEILLKEQKRQTAQFWVENEYKILKTFFIGASYDIDPWIESCVLDCKRYFLKKYGCRYDSAEKLVKKILLSLPLDCQNTFFSAVKGFESLTQPLKGTYSRTSYAKTPKIGQDVIRSIMSLRSFPMISLCYMHPTAPGSIFKVFVAYSALVEAIKTAKNNLQDCFVFTDRVWRASGKTYVGYDYFGKPIPQVYKGGRIPKSSHINNGTLNIIDALAKSSNAYFALLASEYISSPDQFRNTIFSFGYGSKTGISLPWEAKGKVPSDLNENKTGVYTTAIGQHTLLTTPLQTAVALSAVANGGTILVPRLVKMAIDSQHAFPSETMVSGTLKKRQQMYIPKTKVVRAFSIDPSITRILFSGMRGSLLYALDEQSLTRLYVQKPFLLQKVRTIMQHMIGKSSTAESFERLGLGIGQPPHMYNHTWFAGMYFDRPFDENHRPYLQQPSLVVVVFLRYGMYGRDAAHIAARVCDEWVKIRSFCKDTLNDFSREQRPLSVTD